MQDAPVNLVVPSGVFLAKHVQILQEMSKYLSGIKMHTKNNTGFFRNLIICYSFSMFKGEMLHYASKPAARRWTGQYKTDAQEALKNKMPAATRLEFCTKADMAAVKSGKHTSIKTVSTFQMIKHKV